MIIIYPTTTPYLSYIYPTTILYLSYTYPISVLYLSITYQSIDGHHARWCPKGLCGQPWCCGKNREGTSSTGNQGPFLFVIMDRSPVVIIDDHYLAFSIIIYYYDYYYYYLSLSIVI